MRSQCMYIHARCLPGRGRRAPFALCCCRAGERAGVTGFVTGGRERSGYGPTRHSAPQATHDLAVIYIANQPNARFFPPLSTHTHYTMTSVFQPGIYKGKVLFITGGESACRRMQGLRPLGCLAPRPHGDNERGGTARRPLPAAAAIATCPRRPPHSAISPLCRRHGRVLSRAATAPRAALFTHTPRR